MSEAKFCHKCGAYTDHLMDNCPKWNRPGNPYKSPELKKVAAPLMVTAENKRHLQAQAEQWGCTVSEAGNQIIDYHRIKTAELDAELAKNRGGR